MDTSIESDYIQNAELEDAELKNSALRDEKRKKLFGYTIDIALQRLLPPSIVGETVDICGATTGLLLTHQPGKARFRDTDYGRVSRLTNGRKDGYFKIMPFRSDYSLTHTLYYVPEGSSERTILTSELTIPGVDLLKVYTFERDKMAEFLEGISSCPGATENERTFSHSIIFRWLHLPSPNRDYCEPQDVCLLGLNEEDYIIGLRVVCSIHLYSPRDIWIRRVGMDWPRYFFGLKCSMQMWGDIDQPDIPPKTVDETSMESMMQ